MCGIPPFGTNGRLAHRTVICPADCIGVKSRFVVRMCGRFTFGDPKRVNEACFLDFSVHWPGQKPRFNVAPSQLLDVIANDGAGKPAAQSMRWGLVPFWDESEKPKIAPINAKSEEIAAKPMFRQAVQKRRCLVPADGFFEWKKIAEDVKQPYLIGLTENRPFYFASIFEPGNETRPATVALLTTRPNALMEPIHTRMPVIVTGETAKAWLRAGQLTPYELGRLTAPFPPDQMRAVRVSKLVNNPRNTGPEVVAPVATGRTA